MPRWKRLAQNPVSEVWTDDILLSSMEVSVSFCSWVHMVVGISTCEHIWAKNFKVTKTCLLYGTGVKRCLPWVRLDVCFFSSYAEWSLRAAASPTSVICAQWPPWGKWPASCWKALLIHTESSIINNATAGCKWQQGWILVTVQHVHGLWPLSALSSTKGPACTEQLTM